MRRRDRPKVIANFAMTADGKVTTRNHTPARFTSPRDKDRLVEIRAMGGAILVGRNTLETDAMRMVIGRRDLKAARRAKGLPAEPLRVLVSNSGRIDPSAKMFHSRGGRRVVFSTTRMPAAIRNALAPLADLHLFDGKELPIDDVLRSLRHIYGVRTVVCEGGPGLFRSLAVIDAIDTVFVTVAPLVFGGGRAPTLTGTDPGFLPEIRTFRLASMKTAGGECFARYDRR